MCGIAGIYTPVQNSENLALPYVISQMTDSLAHRGPDAKDVWIEQEAGVALGHTRLSVVDLSSAGQQPMVSSSGRYILTYNGEVYNADEIRQEIISYKGIEFRGNSDTEVVLEAIAAWGIEKALSRLIGMFAFAVWDQSRRALIIGRDRLGIKPLYWSYHNGIFLFGSELKCLRQSPNFDCSINEHAVSLYLLQNTVPSPHTIYAHAQKLGAGSYLEISSQGNIRKHNYWLLDDHINGDKSRASGGHQQSAIDGLEDLLSDAVSKRLVADVPLGAFLSGGIDSSLVTALMQKNSSRAVKTFSIGYDEAEYNEAIYAKQIAEHLGTDHTELYITSKDAIDVIPELSTIYDEPFADASQIPTTLLSRLTKQHVTVALSGDGGDELFAGYNRYIQVHTLMQKLWRVPIFMRRAIAQLLQGVPVLLWDKIISHLPVLYQMRMPGEKIHKFAQVLPVSMEDYYPNLISHPQGGELLSYDMQISVSDHWNHSAEVLSDLVERMQYSDILGYMQDDILTKVDRASMAYALEVRVPILDHRVVEYSWTLPQHFKIRDGQGKWALRQILYKYVPRELIERPKMGFAVPIDRWLRGELRDWAEDLLSRKSIDESGLIRYEAIQEKWREHLSGKRNWQYLLWNVLMLQSWHRRWM